MTCSASQSDALLPEEIYNGTASFISLEEGDAQEAESLKFFDQKVAELRSQNWRLVQVEGRGLIFQRWAGGGSGSQTPQRRLDLLIGAVESGDKLLCRIAQRVEVLAVEPAPSGVVPSARGSAYAGEFCPSPVDLGGCTFQTHGLGTFLWAVFTATQGHIALAERHAWHAFDGIDHVVDEPANLVEGALR